MGFDGDGYTDLMNIDTHGKDTYVMLEHVLQCINKKIIYIQEEVNQYWNPGAVLLLMITFLLKVVIVARLSWLFDVYLEGMFEVQLLSFLLVLLDFPKLIR